MTLHSHMNMHLHMSFHHHVINSVVINSSSGDVVDDVAMVV